MSSLFRPPSSPFEPPPLPYRILISPLRFITQTLYTTILYFRGPALIKNPSSPPIRLVCISDTHTHKPTLLPPGDALIHSGDLTNNGTFLEIQDQIDWLSSLPYEHIIVVAGNHDSFFDPRSRRKGDVGKKIRWSNVHYLQHSSVRLSFPNQGNRRLSFYGAPQVPQCGGDEFAFQYRRNDDVWQGTVPNVDVLITHTPPRHHQDLPAGLGCDFLLKEVWRVKPRLMVFGHVHAGAAGVESVFWDDFQKIFESLCARGEKGVMRDMIAIQAWIDVAKLVVYGVLGILWTRVWGGSNEGSLMVNAALAYWSTGKLGNRPQVVEI